MLILRQACTFAANASKLAALSKSSGVSCESINADAIDIACEAAASTGAWVCGSITPTTSFERGAKEQAVKEELKPMVDIFVERKADFLLAEFFSDVVEAEWAIDVLRDAAEELGKMANLTRDSRPAVGVTMRLGPTGDLNGVTPQECAVRLAKRGQLRWKAVLVCLLQMTKPTVSSGAGRGLHTCLLPSGIPIDTYLRLSHAFILLKEPIWSESTAIMTQKRRSTPSS